MYKEIRLIKIYNRRKQDDSFIYTGSVWDMGKFLSRRGWTVTKKNPCKWMKDRGEHRYFLELVEVDELTTKQENLTRITNLKGYLDWAYDGL